MANMKIVLEIDDTGDNLSRITNLIDLRFPGRDTKVQTDVFDYYADKLAEEEAIKLKNIEEADALQNHVETEKEKPLPIINKGSLTAQI